MILVNTIYIYILAVDFKKAANSIMNMKLNIDPKKDLLVKFWWTKEQKRTLTTNNSTTSLLPRKTIRFIRPSQTNTLRNSIIKE